MHQVNTWISLTEVGLNIDANGKIQNTEESFFDELRRVSKINLGEPKTDKLYTDLKVCIMNYQKKHEQSKNGWLNLNVNTYIYIRARLTEHQHQCCTPATHCVLSNF